MPHGSLGRAVAPDSSCFRFLCWSRPPSRPVHKLSCCSFLNRQLNVQPPRQFGSTFGLKDAHSRLFGTMAPVEATAAIQKKQHTEVLCCTCAFVSGTSLPATVAVEQHQHSLNSIQVLAVAGSL